MALGNWFSPESRREVLQVTVVHLSGEFRVKKMLQDRLFANPKIEVIWDHAVDEIVGGIAPEAGVEKLRLRIVLDGESWEIPVDGVFIVIGHSPATALFNVQLQMDEEGYIITKPGPMATNVPGVWAAGDVSDRIYRQAVTAAGIGCMAALELEKWLAEQSLD